MENTNRLRKTILCLLVLQLSVFLFTSISAYADETSDKAAQEAITKAMDSLSAQEFPEVVRIAVVPLRNDPDKAITDILKIAVTKTKYDIILRDDEEWAELLKNIEWETRREDIMNPDTVKELGGILGVDALLYGTVKEIDEAFIRTKVRLNLNLANVQTGQLLWGEMVEGEAVTSYDILLLRYKWYLIGFVAFIVIIFVVKRAMRPR